MPNPNDDSEAVCDVCESPHNLSRIGEYIVCCDCEEKMNNSTGFSVQSLVNLTLDAMGWELLI